MIKRLNNISLMVFHEITYTPKILGSHDGGHQLTIDRTFVEPGLITGPDDHLIKSFGVTFPAVTTISLFIRGQLGWVSPREIREIVETSQSHCGASLFMLIFFLSIHARSFIIRPFSVFVVNAN